ncbi:glycosyltransferase family 2 protein [Maridesulfovibrio zosterae]|uniref:glycosyltransferase family 2 protein n=1 Tax=Maridesulfovibrio zosterae TaxID=82171 RepID=UPI0003FAC668|nr:glycosyltransferase family 2 protein [Maridesulfovibrio zosterae]
MKKPYLSIIIPVLNLWKLTSDCLGSIRDHTNGSFYEVIVVDNGSTDQTNMECSRLGRNLFGDNFHYIRLEKNINFGPACNLGAKKANGSMLFFLNNDTLLTDGWFVSLFEVFRNDPKVMACSPLCLFPENKRIQSLGVGFDGGLNVRHPYFLFPGNHPVILKNRKLQALSAAALMIPAFVFDNLEGFFSEYVNGFEDLDLCCRMRKSGGVLIQENRSVIYHLSSQTPGRNLADSNNIKLINERCGGWFRPDLHKMAMEDGYYCELTSCLEMIVRDHDTSRLAELEHLRAGDEVAAALTEYPLWENGYDKLADIYDADSRMEQMAEILFYGSYLFPTIERLRRLYEIAEKLGHAVYTRHAERKIKSIMNFDSLSTSLNTQAQKVLSWAMDNRDTELIRIYKNWITEYGEKIV